MDNILIAGAGPTGLVLACGLRAAGVPVRVVDAAPGPATTSRALGLQPRGVEVLDRIGALGDLPDRALAMRTVAVHVGDRLLARLALGRSLGPGSRPALLISQAEVEAALRARLAALGGEIEWGRAVEGLEPGPDGVVVTVDGERESAAWVVGCDGAHSRVRSAAGIPFPGVPLGERFLLADVRAPLPLPRDAVSVWLEGETMIGAAPLPGEDVWRLMGSADEEEAHPEVALRERLAQRAGVAVPPPREVLWTSTFRFHRRLADRYRAGRVLLAGDAAHIHSPFGGQGLNTGVGDAENLAWKLALVASGRAGEALLDTYEAERRPVAEEVLAATTGVTRMVLGDGALARGMRDHVLVPLMNRPSVQRFVAQRASQLRVSYRRGPLASWTARRPRPGDRVPDLPVRTADGRASRLHAELGGRFAVVAADPAAALPRAGELRALGDVAVLTSDVPTRDALLVRPDGHLAARGSAETLARWVSAVVGTPVPVPAVP